MGGASQEAGVAELTGRCNCGRVRFRARGPFRDAWGCHCKICRRQSSHFLAATQTDRAGVTIIGEDNLVWYAATDIAERGFCRTCGAHLFWKPAEPGRISILMGALDEPTGIRLAMHICAGEKGDYYDIADGLPQR
jgi:hypothetical protein